jgi:hypothetical protein
MASGHVSRIKRPNTWLHRPMLQNREKSSCQTGAVHTWQILLQKSKVASVRIFGEILKREAIDDSDNLSRVTEVANEFSVRR